MRAGAAGDSGFESINQVVAAYAIHNQKNQ
jgi:hypothetical protein